MKNDNCKNPRCIDGIVRCNRCVGHCADFCDECFPDEPCSIELEHGEVVVGDLEIVEGPPLKLSEVDFDS